MLFNALVVFVILNILISLFKRKSIILLYASIIFIVIVFVGSRGVADLHNYTYDFAHGYERFWKGGQFLFHFITESCHKIGMSFDLYRCLLSILGLSLYLYLIKSYSPLPNMVIAAYMSYLMIMDDVQIRNFLGCAVFGLAIYSLFEQKNNWRNKYVFWIVIASTIHSSFWVYLIFLLIPKNINDDGLIKKIGIGALIFSVVVLFTREYLNNIVMFFSFIDEEKTEHYLLETTRFGGALFAIIQVFVIMCILYLKRNIFSKCSTAALVNDKTYVILQISLLINILSLVLVPAAIFSITFYRLLRNLFFVNAIVFTIGYYRMKFRLLAFLMLFIYTGLFYYYDLTGETYILEILVPFFNNNIYF